VQTGLQTGIPEEHKQLMSSEWLSTTQSNTYVAGIYKLDAEPVQKDTFLISSDDAGVEAIRQRSLYSEPRTIYGFDGFESLIDIELGQAVTLKHPRFGLSAGKTGMVISRSPDWIKRRVSLEVLI
jgi:hypothetical protein